MMRTMFRTGIAVIGTPAMCGFGQSTTPRPKFEAFEVASVKPSPPDAVQGRWIRMVSANEFEARNHTLKTLIAAAYGVSPHAISGGPGWADSDHYDILARTPGTVRPTLDEQMTMLRSLLEDRFHLTIHHTSAAMGYYALTVASGGPKLKGSNPGDYAASPEGPPPLVFVVSPQLVQMPARDASMTELASVLQRAALDEPVVDKTGLSDRFDFDLEFAPDESVFGGMLGKGPEDAAKPGLFTAIQQQLGLKLQSTHGLVDTLVVDHAERPSGN